MADDNLRVVRAVEARVVQFAGTTFRDLAPGELRADLDIGVEGAAGFGIDDGRVLFSFLTLLLYPIHVDFARARSRAAQSI